VGGVVVPGGLITACSKAGYFALRHHGAGVEEASRITEADLASLRDARCKVEHTWQIDAERFDKAELVIRYFPDAEHPHRFIDTTYAILD